jgi:hypothetical protein
MGYDSLSYISDKLSAMCHTSFLSDSIRDNLINEMIPLRFR